METTNRPMAGMDHIVRHVIWDRERFWKERGHNPERNELAGRDDLASQEARCSVCGAKAIVIATKGSALVITDEMTVSDCGVEGHVLHEPGDL